METLYVNSLKTRYKDAYSVAAAMATSGSITKVVGMVLGLVILTVAVIIGQSTDALITVFGLVLALALGGVIFILGVVTAAIGQLLKASLDSAVNTSPFLSLEARAEIMSLTRSTEISDQSSGGMSGDSTKTHDSSISLLQPITEANGWQCRCGQTNPDDVTKCPNCGRTKGAVV